MSVGMMLVLIAGCGFMSGDERKPVHISRFMGRYLLTQGHGTVAMVGVSIPRPGDVNYVRESFQYAESLLRDQAVEIRTVEKKHKVGYPPVDLVEVFLNGKNINQHLLETGNAFFSEDYWNKKEKEVYKQLEQAAREKGIGIWANQADLTVLFVRDKNGRHAHYPDCAYVKDLLPEDRVNYYTHLPWTIFATRIAYHCYFCKARYKKERQAAEERSEKIARLLKNLRLSRQVAVTQSIKKTRQVTERILT